MCLLIQNNIYPVIIWQNQLQKYVQRWFCLCCVAGSWQFAGLLEYDALALSEFISKPQKESHFLCQFHAPTRLMIFSAKDTTICVSALTCVLIHTFVMLATVQTACMVFWVLCCVADSVSDKRAHSRTYRSQFCAASGWVEPDYLAMQKALFLSFLATLQNFSWIALCVSARLKIIFQFHCVFAFVHCFPHPFNCVSVPVNIEASPKQFV